MLSNKMLKGNEVTRLSDAVLDGIYFFGGKNSTENRGRSSSKSPLMEVPEFI